MTEQLLAWYGSRPLKEEVMERLRKHREADAIIQGEYQRLAPGVALGYRGCAIGCTLPQQPKYACGCGCADGPECPERGWHGEVEHLYGIDARIGLLIDDVFESLPPDDCAAFAVDVIDAIPVGADLSSVSEWADGTGRRTWNREGAPVVAAEFIDLLRNAPVPTPA